MSQPQNLPDLLQARLKLSLLNWSRRTLIWSAVLGLFAMQVPFAKVLLIGWLVFSGLSLAGLLLGLKLARHLKTATVTPITVNRTPHAHSGPIGDQEMTPEGFPRDGHSGRREVVEGEVIEIDAEVLPADEKPPRA